MLWRDYITFSIVKAKLFKKKKHKLVILKIILTKLITMEQYTHAIKRL